MNHRSAGTRPVATPATAKASNGFVASAGQCGRGTLQRAYPILALFALINLAVLAGLGALLVASGRLDSVTAGRLLAVLRGQPEPQPAGPAAPGNKAEADELVKAGEPSEAAIRAALEARELERLTTDRLRVDLQHERALLDRRMLQLQQDLEQFEHRAASHESRLTAERERQFSESFRQMVQTVAGLRPRSAVEALMARPDAEAAQILMDMTSRKRHQIVDACRTAEQVRWRDAMFDAMLQVSAQSQPLDGGAQ